MRTTSVGGYSIEVSTFRWMFTVMFAPYGVLNLAKLRKKNSCDRDERMFLDIKQLQKRGNESSCGNFHFHENQNMIVDYLMINEETAKFVVWTGA
jgi:hypothetical protein